MLALRAVPLSDVPHRDESRLSLDRLPLIITVLRIPLVIAIAVAYLQGSPALAVVLVGVFVISDVADGEWARRLNVETAFRRLIDGLIDRVSVHAMLVVVAVEASVPATAWMLLLARDVSQAVIGARALRSRGVVFAGAPWHRIYTLLIATWGSLLMTSTAVPQWLLAAVLAAGGATLLDYSLKVRRSETAPIARQNAQSGR